MIMESRQETDGMKTIHRVCWREQAEAEKRKHPAGKNNLTSEIIGVGKGLISRREEEKGDKLGQVGLTNDLNTTGPRCPTFLNQCCHISEGRLNVDRTT